MWIGPWYLAVPSFCLSTSHLCCHPVLPISILPRPPLPTLEVPKNKIVYTLVSILNISRQSLVFLDVCGSKTSTSISNLACLIITSCVWTESSFKLGGKCVSAKQHGRSAASLPLCLLFIKTRDKQADMRDYSVVQRKNAGEIVTRTEVFLPILFTCTNWKDAGNRLETDAGNRHIKNLFVANMAWMIHKSIFRPRISSVLTLWLAFADVLLVCPCCILLPLYVFVCDTFAAEW